MVSWVRLSFFDKFLSELFILMLLLLEPCDILIPWSCFFKASISYFAYFMSLLSKFMSLVFSVVNPSFLVILSFSSLIYLLKLSSMAWSLPLELWLLLFWVFLSWLFIRLLFCFNSWLSFSTKSLRWAKPFN